MRNLPVKRALLSVTDKSGLVEFAAFLHDNGVELVSTGGTYKILEAAGLKPLSVSEATGFPEIMDGRVKTLHPHIHAGILADKNNPSHLETLSRLGLKAFDCVCVNLYNFAGAAARKVELGAAVEQIDIGGPCMLRAAAKNFNSILVVPDCSLYPEVRRELDRGDFTVSLDLRRRYAARTFAMTAAYDKMIAGYLTEQAPR